MAVIVEIEFPHRAAVESAFSTEWQLAVSLTRNLASQLTVLPFVCYIVGSIGASLFNGLLKIVSGQLRKWGERGRVDSWAVRSSGQPQADSFARWFDGKPKASPIDGHGAFGGGESGDSEFARDGAREHRQAFPAAEITRDLPATLLQLSKEAPDRYQQIDRLRGEVEFRIAVAFPLFLFIGLVSLDGPWWVAPLLVIPVGLAWPSLRLRQKSNDLLITAAHLGYVEQPVLSAVRTELEPDGITRDSAVVALVWMKNFLTTVGAEELVIKDAEQRDEWERAK
ncbi:hypothetical protein F1D05_25805 [Kribbella qitaiheensis]|uniref:Uncharacterized protein n=1 Tax=Kribbella qitaiheensis TaxID=1544730 RepID=A0A7G6X388_9ACTN|nr:hypothetical protein [Kribbella qitaiheensis]QNE20703.1 hypothetical protein F1D05_25805 [Kribbella qitaiheensis]